MNHMLLHSHKKHEMAAKCGLVKRGLCAPTIAALSAQRKPTALYIELLYKAASIEPHKVITNIVVIMFHYLPTFPLCS